MHEKHYSFVELNQEKSLSHIMDRFWGCDCESPNDMKSKELAPFCLQCGAVYNEDGRKAMEAHLEAEASPISYDSGKTLSFDEDAIVLHIAETIERFRNEVLTLGYSGGKDSSVLLSMTFKAYETFGLNVPLTILYSNTGLETSQTRSYVKEQITYLEAYLDARPHLPIKFKEVGPRPQEGMWVRILGYGVQIPLNAQFTWCTQFLKLNPMARQIKALTGTARDQDLCPAGRINKRKAQEENDGKPKQVISLAGVRADESSTRKTKIEGKLVDAKGHLLESAMVKGGLVYAPIRHMTNEQVWEYIAQERLAYAPASSLFQIYDQTDSSGSLRNGCIFCPKVQRDTMLELEVKRNPALKPLIKWRNYLVRLKDPKYKSKLKSFRKKRGDIKMGESGDFHRGGYTQRVRAHFLKVVLHAQKQVQKKDPAFEWITDEDLRQIRAAWLYHWGEHEDLFPNVYSSVYKRCYDEITQWEQAWGLSRSLPYQELAGREKELATLDPNRDVFLLAKRNLRVQELISEGYSFSMVPGTPVLQYPWEEREYVGKLIAKTDWRSEECARRDLEGNPHLWVKNASTLKKEKLAAQVMALQPEIPAEEDVQMALNF